MKSVLNRIMAIFSSQENESVVHFTPQDINANFELTYKGHSIGKLTLARGEWTFVYADEFKKQSEINLITGFPDPNKVYKSNSLFPFFAFRIPSQQRLKIQKLADGNVYNDEVVLLKKFGRQTIVNPYHLIYSGY